MTIKTIAFANHKGGVGKTTSTVVLASELALQGRRVLIVDLDAQANASSTIGKQDPNAVEISAAEVLTGDVSLIKYAIEQDTGYDGVSLLYGNGRLTGAEDDLRYKSARPYEELKKRLQQVKDEYDYVLIDCPPSVRTLTYNALVAADAVIIPFESGAIYSSMGMLDVMHALNGTIDEINPDLINLGILLIKHDQRQLVCQHVKAELEKREYTLIPVTIPESTVFKKASMVGSPLYEEGKKSKGRLAYLDLANFIVEKMEGARNDQ